MAGCLDGLEQFFAAVSNWCNTELSGSKQQPKGLKNPELIANETLCELSFPFSLSN